ncbi:DUF4403 family protein [Flavobacterium sp. GSP27]|uniref:DUF4403 family protein n=1 Tax=Flavobacterium sp. GSP27 TaxID=2497489 RepID=UPI000F820C89|nr:DUF4403 family protein [Flavobacterium sp. GSP27]RTY95665.1 DUF4403 family protein [Flavobacterium sp. GSN2]RTZ08789.1 DUF4403 family protein [Flavobacterium sp. GSP27]
MPKTLSTLLTLCSIILFFSCSSTNQIEALKPEPDDATPLVYENTPSFINLPISIKLKEIQNQTNTLMNGLIYEDNNINDDGIEMKVWKLAPISIVNDPENSGEKIKTILPLKAVVKYRIGTKKMGIELYDTREFNLNGVITLVSEISLTNWKLNTTTQLQSLDWNESPTMRVFGKNVPVTYLINPAIQLFKSKIENKIDAAIAKSMDFKPNVLAALEKICTPFQMSTTYNSWLRIVPIEIYSTNAQLKKDTFVLQMGMKCNMETIIGQEPDSKFDASKIILKPVTKIPEAITANIIAVSTYQEASKIMTKNFAGQEFSSGSKKVKVQNVAIWHKTGKMIIALEITGSVNGTLYLSGLPKYNEQTKEIYFDQLTYALDTKNKLMRTASWLAQGFVLRKMEQSCRYSLIPNLEEGQKNILPYLKNYSPMQGVFINGKMENIQFQRIQLTNQAILAFIKVKGTINVAINSLK